MRIPYGFVLISGETLEVNKDEANIVSMIFDFYMAGASLGKVVDMLHSKQISSPTGKLKWTRATVDHLLSNGKYVAVVGLEKFLDVQFEKAARCNIDYDREGSPRKDIRYVSPAMVQIGYNFIRNLDGKFERSIVELRKPGKVVFSGKCCLGSGTRLNVHGTLTFGDNVRINGNSNICCFSDVEIGGGTIVSWDCLFMDTDFHKIYEDGKITNENSPIKIGKNCWIGCRATVLKGSEVPDGCVVGAGSLVCKKFGRKNSVYGGSPAKNLKENIRWEE